jgi:hypothetical protein
MAGLRLSYVALIGLAVCGTACNRGSQPSRGAESAPRAPKEQAAKPAAVAAREPGTVLRLLPYHLLCQARVTKHVAAAMRIHGKAVERVSKLDWRKDTVSEADAEAVRQVQRARLQDAAETFRWLNERSEGKRRYGEAYRQLQPEMKLYLGTENVGNRDPQSAFKKLVVAVDIDLGDSIRSAFAQGGKGTRSAQAYEENHAAVDAAAEADWKKGLTKAQDTAVQRVRMAYWVDVANAIQDLSTAVAADPFAAVSKREAQRIAGMATKDWRTLKKLAEADEVAMCGCWQAYLDTRLP